MDSGFQNKELFQLKFPVKVNNKNYKNIPCLYSIWTGLFANLKKIGGRGGGNELPPNLAISCQMTIKLGKDILWVEIFTN